MEQERLLRDLDIERRRIPIKNENIKAGGKKWLVIILAAVAALLAVSVVVSGILAAASGCIFPRVTACGVEVGGMTEEEALEKLSSSDFNGYGGKAVTIFFADQGELTVRADEIGLACDAQQAAPAAYNYGRNGNFLTNAFAYLRCLIAGKEVIAEYAGRMDEDALREVVSRAAEEVNSELSQSLYEIDEEYVVVVKGVNEVQIDESEVFSLIKDAFEKKNFEDILYTPEIVAPEQIQFDRIQKAVYTEPKDAYLEGLEVVPHVVGVDLDVEKAKSIFEAAEDGDTVRIPLVITEPEMTSEKLASMLFRDQLASYTSSLTSNEDRSTNIELSANACNDTVLLPGEQFSFNDVVGERTREKGYKAATAYAGGEIVQEVGGGICQTSSSIYMCCLLADLEIVYRTEHMYASSYVPLGMDATVSWGGPEFIFANNTEYPIKIKAWRHDGYLTVEIYGTKTDDSYVEMDYEVLEVLNYDVIYKEDSRVPAGEQWVDEGGITGYRVQTYKYRYDGDGNLIECVAEAYSEYDKCDEIILVPVGTLTLSPSPSPSEDPVVLPSAGLPETSEGEQSPELPGSDENTIDVLR